MSEPKMKKESKDMAILEDIHIKNMKNEK